jgi:hypothetical protein
VLENERTEGREPRKFSGIKELEEGSLATIRIGIGKYFFHGEWSAADFLFILDIHDLVSHSFLLINVTTG